MKYIILIIVALWCTTASGQKRGQELADSLLNELPKQKDDSNKVMLLGRLGRAYMMFNVREVNNFVEMQLDMIVPVFYKQGILAEGKIEQPCFKMYLQEILQPRHRLFKTIGLERLYQKIERGRFKSFQCKFRIAADKNAGGYMVQLPAQFQSTDAGHIYIQEKYIGW